jgi:hypothetical protein
VRAPATTQRVRSEAPDPEGFASSRPRARHRLAGFGSTRCDACGACHALVIRDSAGVARLLSNNWVTRRSGPGALYMMSLRKLS